MKAIDLGPVNPSANGDQRLYKVDPPVKDYEWSGGGEHEYVVASAVVVLGDPETYLFPSNEKGVITDWGELSGSQKGTLSHADVITDLGYEIVAAE